MTVRTPARGPVVRRHWPPDIPLLWRKTTTSPSPTSSTTTLNPSRLTERMR